jgi:hypothetical protein
MQPDINVLTYFSAHNSTIQNLMAGMSHYIIISYFDVVGRFGMLVYNPRSTQVVFLYFFRIIFKAVFS